LFEEKISKELFLEKIVLEKKDFSLFQIFKNHIFYKQALLERCLTNNSLIRQSSKMPPALNPPN
jgi:hypothetical protein